jgi:hypothetical protein
MQLVFAEQFHDLPMQQAPPRRMLGKLLVRSKRLFQPSQIVGRRHPIEVSA